MRAARHILGVLVLGFLARASLGADPGLLINVDQPGARISPMFYGLMTEEINHSYDGGLYAELIQNRIFQDNHDAPVHWSVFKNDGATGTITMDETDPVNTTALRRSLRLDIQQVPAGGRVGMANDGFWGIPVLPHTKYRASFYARAGDDFHGPLTVDIQSADGKKIFASKKVKTPGTAWKKYEVELETGDVPASKDNLFVISATTKGPVWFSLVSLFPPTYNNRPNGNRIDLMKILGAMQPAFLRLPGGNYLEGNQINERFNWYKTIGPLQDRPGHQGPWGYRSSDGMGLLEFLDWCEDLHMEPLLAVYAGYSLRGAHVQPGKDLEPYVKEAMDELEYVTGDKNTKWGAERAKDGHPRPFALHYVEIGNEDWFDRSHTYDARFAQFYDAIKAKYPSLQIIATTVIHGRTPDVIDDHYYRSARAFELDVHHYDNYPRSSPKIFVGEWATQEGRPTPDLNAALSDAAWLTGLERNADVVAMASYAPLLVNVSPAGAQWGTNLIGYDALSSFGSPSYYAQKMFMTNRGDVVLPVDLSMPQNAMEPAPPPSGEIGIGTWATQAEFKDIKVTDGNTVLYNSDFSKSLHEWRRRTGQWRINDGSLQQIADDRPDEAFTGKQKWTDYTYSLKARKISGDEGFLIMFHYQGRKDLLTWNLGGWGNTHSAIDQTQNGDDRQLSEDEPVKIETGKWYDIRVELHGQDVKCYLNGKLIDEVSQPPARPLPPLFAAASRDNSDGDVILKVVNISDDPQMLPIKLKGLSKVARDAKVQVLSGNRQEVNSLEHPDNVVPRRADIDNASSNFMHQFPPRSVTVMRIKTH